MMLEKFLARFGYVPVGQVAVLDRALSDAQAALEAAWAEADRERHRRQELEDTPRARLAVVSEQAGRLAAAHGR